MGWWFPFVIPGSREARLIEQSKRKARSPYEKKKEFPTFASPTSPPDNAAGAAGKPSAHVYLILLFIAITLVFVIRIATKPTLEYEI